MTPMMEKLEDGRLLFNNDGVRDYLCDFLCDAAADAKRQGDINDPIMAMLASMGDDKRDDMIVNMVDAMFDSDGRPLLQVLNIAYKTIFGMELLQKGDHFYASHVKGED